MHSACGFDKSVTTVKCVIDSGDINNFRVILILHGRRGPRNSVSCRIVEDSLVRM